MAQQSPSSAFPSSSSSSFSYAFRYDVFLSFRGSDTRQGFTGNLYRALRDSGIHAFIDDEELKGGDEIKPSLIEAIKESRIAIPVFSENYASSSFTLDELVTITEFVKGEGRLVLPVFYRVDPSHVRHQTESYGKTLAKHEERFQKDKEKYKDNMERMRKWKKALSQAADLSGKHFILGNEYEHEFIGKIVKEVSDKINRLPLLVADYPIGLESRVLQVQSLLDVGLGSNDGFNMVGIYGVGGMGKTTLARATYNLIADRFEGLCFLHKVRENSTKHLQEKLLSKTVGLNIEIGDVNEGIPIIKHRLHRTKVLLILDDVDKLEQLRDLAGGPEWFGPGSRVIITTRDKQLLASHGIERTYEVHGLNKEEALELLKWKAFKNIKVDSSYDYVINRAITYASGLPLALEVVGSNLFGKDVDKWQSTLDRCERIPNKEVQEILKISFDYLEEDEQCVFLDIACCFNGYLLAELEDILCAHHGQCMKHHIGVLVEKSLIKISQIYFETRVTLHDLIEDMGKEIVRQESPKELGKRSRLWFHKDIVEVLEENTGTSQIEIIYLACPLSEEVVEWKGDEFKKMENLKTLIIKSGRFSKGPEHLPNSLRVLEWPRYPSQNVPSGFCPKKLSICNLRESCLTSFELRGILKAGLLISLPSTSISKHNFNLFIFFFFASFLLQGFMNMSVLNLYWCRSLTRICDLSSLPNLEKLILRYCKNLIAIHESVGFLSKLKILDATGCGCLRKFPPIRLTSLQQLILENCKSLENFPEILGEMKTLTDLDLSGTCIEELPSSIEKLSQLRSLRLWDSKSGMLKLPNSIVMIPELSELIVGYCHVLPKQDDKLSSMVSSNVQYLALLQCELSDESLLTVLTWFANVTELVLPGNDFTIIPECIKDCRFLRSLDLSDCHHLREIRGVPPHLKFLNAYGCKSLTSSCRSMLLNQQLHEARGTCFELAGIAGIPEWFEHRSREPSISFWFRHKLPSIALFIVSDSGPNQHRGIAPKLIINGYKYTVCKLIGGFQFKNENLMDTDKEHTYLFDPQLQELESKLKEPLLKNEWNHVEVTFWGVCVPGFSSIEMGIHVFEQESSMEDIQFTNPYNKK